RRSASAPEAARIENTGGRNESRCGADGECRSRGRPQPNWIDRSAGSLARGVQPSLGGEFGKPLGLAPKGSAGERASPRTHGTGHSRSVLFGARPEVIGSPPGPRQQSASLGGGCPLERGILGQLV